MPLQTPYTNEQMLRLLALAHGHSNPSFLDNGFFIDPVNQRKQTNYTTAGYSIDRWRFNPAGGSLTLSDGGIVLAGGGAADPTILEQPIELDRLRGKIITFSVLAGAKTGGAYLSQSGISDTHQENIPIQPNTVTTYTLPVDSTSEIGLFRIWTSLSSSLKLIAAKGEVGPIQTLAAPGVDGIFALTDPDPGRQEILARCQRYFRVYRTESARPAYAEDCSPVMRTDPVQGTLTINGVTYYTNSADL